MGTKEFFPLLIPLIIVQSGLLIYAFRRIFTHSAYKHENRMIRVIIVIVGMQFISPVLYLILGKEDAQWLS